MPQLAQETLRDARDVVGGRAFAVRAVTAFRQHRHVTRRSSVAAHRLAHRVELARLGARIPRAVNDQRRHAQLAEPSVVEIGGRRGCDRPRSAARRRRWSESDRASRRRARAPAPRRPARRARPGRASSSRRTRATPACAARNAPLRRSDRSAARARPAPSAARSPRRRCVPRPPAIETERVDHRECFGGGAMVKVGLLPREAARAAVAGAIGDDQSMARGERRDLAIERVDLVAPAAVKNHDRRSRAGVAIVHANRRLTREQARTKGAR